MTGRVSSEGGPSSALSGNSQSRLGDHYGTLTALRNSQFSSSLGVAGYASDHSLPDVGGDGSVVASTHRGGGVTAGSSGQASANAAGSQALPQRKGSTGRLMLHAEEPTSPAVTSSLTRASTLSTAPPKATQRIGGSFDPPLGSGINAAPRAMAGMGIELLGSSSRQHRGSLGHDIDVKINQGQEDPQLHHGQSHHVKMTDGTANLLQESVRLPENRAQQQIAPPVDLILQALRTKEVSSDGGSAPGHSSRPLPDKGSAAPSAAASTDARLHKALSGGGSAPHPPSSPAAAPPVRASTSRTSQESPSSRPQILTSSPSLDRHRDQIQYSNKKALSVPMLSNVEARMLLGSDLNERISADLPGYSAGKVIGEGGVCRVWAGGSGGGLLSVWKWFNSV